MIEKLGYVIPFDDGLKRKIDKFLVVIKDQRLPKSNFHQKKADFKAGVAGELRFP